MKSDTLYELIYNNANNIPALRVIWARMAENFKATTGKAPAFAWQKNKALSPVEMCEGLHAELAIACEDGAQWQSLARLTVMECYRTKGFRALQTGSPS